MDKRLFEKMARSYFNGAERFMEVRVPEDEAGPGKVLAFLKQAGVAAECDAESFEDTNPNTRNLESMQNKDAVLSYYPAIDRILAGGPPD